MSDVNVVTLSGRVVRTPEVRSAPSGNQVADLYLANNLYNRNGEQNTTFVRCTIWGKSAEFTGTLNKGDHVFVTGQLASDDYETTKGDPSSMTKGRMKVTNCKITLLGRKKEE